MTSPAEQTRQALESVERRLARCESAEEWGHEIDALDLLVQREQELQREVEALRESETEWQRRGDRAIAAEQQVQELQREIEQVRASNASLMEHRATIQGVIDRAERAEATNTRLRAVIGGLLQGGMATAWEWASKQDEWWYVSDLMRALGVTPTHANNYAHELTEKGLLDRERSDPARGGKQFRYRARAALADAEQEKA